ncbi:MAG TPA: hypothetical protein PK971_05920, partial [Saprospiraceae bacterium]|nr:hypothetical protein [Saprospiraceae bacterium]
MVIHLFLRQFQGFLLPTPVHLEVQSRSVGFEEFDHDLLFASLLGVEFVFFGAPDAALFLTAEFGMWYMLVFAAFGRFLQMVFLHFERIAFGKRVSEFAPQPVQKANGTIPL